MKIMELECFNLNRATVDKEFMVTLFDNHAIPTVKTKSSCDFRLVLAHSLFFCFYSCFSLHSGPSFSFVHINSDFANFQSSPLSAVSGCM